MATETQVQNESSRSPITGAQKAVSRPVPAVLIAGFIGAFLFSVKVQAGIASLSPADHIGVIATDPFGTVMVSLLAWFFVALPAAGGVFLADN
ncbi:hypothetical protein [Halorubellus sp. PRR65]|uniref:hypothetical protein n=1 Tax=Halorubellus sp. PRR65 TaxID=3098148 RepID=UPI002B25E14E|nr:hypothetical protein [Halorubellus sp. PRR65]